MSITTHQIRNAANSFKAKLGANEHTRATAHDFGTFADAVVKAIEDLEKKP